MVFPWDNRGEESPPASALSTPQFLSAQQEISPSSPSFLSEDGPIYCLSPESIASYSLDTLLSLHEDPSIIENSLPQLSAVSNPDEAARLEHSRFHRTILSASRQEPENPSTNERSSVRVRRTEDGDQPSSGEVSRQASVSDEGYFSKQNSGHACLEPMLAHAPDDSSLRFTCDLDSRSFNRISDLDRHRHDVHPNEYPPTWVFPCPVPGCARGAQPFARRDKCIAHLRQRHPSNNLPILRLANPDNNTTTSCYSGACLTESIQPASRNHRESRSTVSHPIRDKYRRSDHILDDNILTSDSEPDTSEIFRAPFSSLTHLAKSQAIPIGLDSNEEDIEYRSRDKQSQIERYLNDAVSDPASHRLVAFPNHVPGPGENPPFSWRTGQNTTSSRGIKNGKTSKTHNQEEKERRQKRPRTGSQASSYQSIRPRVDSIISSNGGYTEASQQGQDANIVGSEPSYTSPSFQGSEYFPSAETLNRSSPQTSEDFTNEGFNNVLSPYQTQPSRRQLSAQPLPTITGTHPSRELHGNYNMDTATVSSYSQQIGSVPRETATTANDQVRTPHQTTTTSTSYAFEDPYATSFIANPVLLQPQTPAHFGMLTSPSYQSTATPLGSPTQDRPLSPQSPYHHNARQYQAPDSLPHRAPTPSRSFHPNPPFLSYHTYDHYPPSFTQDTIDPSFLTPTRSTASQPSTGTPHTAPSLTMTRSPSNNRSEPSGQTLLDPPLYDPEDCAYYGTERKLNDDVFGFGGNFSEDDVGMWPLDLEGPYQGN